MKFRSACLVLTLCFPNAVFAFDWSGYYVGVTVGNSSGLNEYIDVETDEVVESYSLSGVSSTVFVGRNWNVGNVKLGSEVSLGFADVFETSPAGIEFPTYRYVAFSDLKLRASIPVAEVEAFVAVGTSAAVFDFDGSGLELDGRVAGFGFQAPIKNGYFWGAEVLERRLKREFGDLDGRIRTLSFRVGKEF